MNKLKKIAAIIGLLLISIAILYLGVRTDDRELNLADIESIDTQSTYEIEPIDISKTGGSAVVYPVIADAYTFPQALHQLVSSTPQRKSAGLSEANLLIAQIDAWGKRLSLVKDLDMEVSMQPLSIKDRVLVFNLQDWWLKNEPRPWEVWKVKTYGSWEGYLARYYLLVDSEIKKSLSQNKNEAISDLAGIRQNIYQNQQRINAAINALANFDNEDKAYLQQLADAVFSQLNQRIDRDLPQSDFNYLVYLPTETINQNNYGQYSLSLSGDLGCYQYINTNLDIVAKPEVDQEPPPGCSYKNDGYEVSEQQEDLGDININDPNDYLSLRYEPKNLIDSLAWTDEKGLLVTKNSQTESEAEPIINPDTGEVEIITKSYYQKVPLETTGKYYFRGYIPTEKPSVVEIRLGETMLFSHVLPDSDKLLLDQLISLPPDNSTASADIKLLTLEGVDPAKSDLQLAPAYEPVIILTKSEQQASPPSITISRVSKNNYLVTVTNLSKDGIQQILGSAGFGWRKNPVITPDATQNIYRLTWVLADWFFIIGAFGLFSALLVYVNAIKLFWLASLQAKILGFVGLLIGYSLKPIRLVGWLVYQVCLFLRTPLIAGALLGIIYDVFYLKATSDTVIFVLWSLWLASVIGWRLEGRFSYLLALLFLIFCPFLLIGKNEAIAEKSAIWTYMFLLAGTIQQIVELKVKSLKLVEIETIGGYLFFQSKKAWQVYRNEGLEAFVHYADRHLGGWFADRRDYVRGRLDAIEKYSYMLPRLPIGYLIRLSVKLFRKVFVFVYESWFLLLSLLLVLILFTRLAGEFNFYENFFEEAYLRQISTRLLPYMAGYWFAILLASTVISKLRWYLRGPVLINALIWLILGNNLIFGQVRNKFEFSPYILKLSPDIADDWSEVKIIGRNFNDLPFKGKVFVGGVQQRTTAWSNKEVTFIVDPNTIKTGEVLVVNDYGNRKGVASNPVPFTYYNWRETTQELRDRYWKSIMERARLKSISKD